MRTVDDSLHSPPAHDVEKLYRAFGSALAEACLAHNHAPGEKTSHDCLLYRTLLPKTSATVVIPPDGKQFREPDRRASGPSELINGE